MIATQSSLVHTSTYGADRYPHADGADVGAGVLPIDSSIHQRSNGGRLPAPHHHLELRTLSDTSASTPNLRLSRT